MCCGLYNHNNDLVWHLRMTGYFWLHAQMLQRVVAVAAESLKVLEHQLMDGSQTQDVRVGTKRLNTWIHSLNHWTLVKWFTSLSSCRWSCALPWTSTTCWFTSTPSRSPSSATQSTPRLSTMAEASPLALWPRPEGPCLSSTTTRCPSIWLSSEWVPSDPC